MIAANDGQETNPLDMRIKSLEKNIEDIEIKIQTAQQSWLRQENCFVNISQQKTEQMQQLSNISKKIITMEHQNCKLELELEKQKKEEANILRTIDSLQKKLLQINLRLTSQKQVRNDLEDKNRETETNYVKSLQDAEIELIKLKTDIKQIIDEENSLKKHLNFLQQETLSWEKKVKF